MENQELQSDPVLEILDAGKRAEWHVTPGERIEYPIHIRNGTVDTHDIEISIADALEWASLSPARITLGPGQEATAALVLTVPADTHVSAGMHTVVLMLHDFEGTSFGQLVGSVNVSPRYQIDMTLTVRSPLLRREIAEGFLLRCVLVNRGNVECVVQPQGDQSSGLSFQSPTVRVPVGGNVSFDIEVRWQDPMREYPASIVVNAKYPEGEAIASVPWDDVVSNLGSLVPPLLEDEDFPNILAWQATDAKVASGPGSTADRTAGEMVAGVDPPELEPEPSLTPASPVHLQISGPVKYTYGRRINPWWPPAERFGGRWRVKALPLGFLALVIGLGIFFTSYRGSISEMSAGHLGLIKHTAPRAVAPKRTALARTPHVASRSTASHGIVSPLRRSTPRPTKLVTSSAHRNSVVAQATPLRAALNETHPIVLPGATARKPQIPKGDVWEGTVIHISAGNVKVYSPGAKSARSFIVSQNFKSVFSPDGVTSYPMNDIRPGMTVRVFYSYVFGVRHPNAIFILRRP